MGPNLGLSQTCTNKPILNSTRFRRVGLGPQGPKSGQIWVHMAALCNFSLIDRFGIEGQIQLNSDYQGQFCQNVKNW